MRTGAISCFEIASSHARFLFFFLGETEQIEAGFLVLCLAIVQFVARKMQDVGPGYTQPFKRFLAGSLVLFALLFSL